MSIGRYEEILEKLNAEKCDIIFGTDHNFDYNKVNTHKNIEELFNSFDGRGVLPTITKPTRITHCTATLIDNIYVKCNNTINVISGIFLNDISDHLAVFILVGGKPRTKDKEPLSFKCRSITDNAVLKITDQINATDWNMLSNMSAGRAYDYFMQVLLDALDDIAPEKIVTIPSKSVVREP